MRFFFTVALLALGHTIEQCGPDNGDAIPNILPPGTYAIINCSASGNLVHDVAIRNFGVGSTFSVYSSYGVEFGNCADPFSTYYYPGEHSVRPLTRN